MANEITNGPIRTSQNSQTVEGVILRENIVLAIEFINNGSIFYYFTMWRAIGDRSYFFSQKMINSVIIFTEINTTMNSEEMSNFTTEWLEKWNPALN